VQLALEGDAEHRSYFIIALDHGQIENVADIVFHGTGDAEPVERAHGEGGVT